MPKRLDNNARLSYPMLVGISRALFAYRRRFGGLKSGKAAVGLLAQGRAIRYGAAPERMLRTGRQGFKKIEEIMMGNLALHLSPESREDEHPEPDPEAHWVQEARDIVAGNSAKTPKLEHLEALINWLDGSVGSVAEPENTIPF